MPQLPKKEKDTIENVQCCKQIHIELKNVKFNNAKNSEMEEFSMSLNPSKPQAHSFEPMTIVLQASGSLGWAAWHDILKCKHSLCQPVLHNPVSSGIAHSKNDMAQIITAAAPVIVYT